MPFVLVVVLSMLVVVLSMLVVVLSVLVVVVLETGTHRSSASLHSWSGLHGLSPS